MPLWLVLFLGVLEGLTEFVPVSSTGHLLLAGHFLGFDADRNPMKTFVVLIQLGAILAILGVYSHRILRMLIDLPSDKRTQRFVLGVLAAFLPAAAIGAVAHKYIKQFFEYPMAIAAVLVLGGIVLLVVDRMKLQPRYHDIMDYPVSLAFKIGLCQCVAMIAGVSRSGATIVGGMLMGTDKRSAAEFSFFLAMPTMVGAFAYDLYKNWHQLDPRDLTSIGIGFATACIAGFFVVRYVLDYIGRHGFALFAWWRIIVGGMALGAMAVMR